MTAFATFLLVVALAGAGLTFAVVQAARSITAAQERQRLTNIGSTPEEVKVPRRERAPDPARAAACLEEAVILLASAGGALATPFQYGSNDKQVLDTDLLDAITDVRHALELLREAAERSPAVDSGLRAAGVDPWTEDAVLDAVHIQGGRADAAFKKAARYAGRLHEAASACRTLDASREMA